MGQWFVVASHSLLASTAATNAGDVLAYLNMQHCVQQMEHDFGNIFVVPLSYNGDDGEIKMRLRGEIGSYFFMFLPGCTMSCPCR